MLFRGSSQQIKLPISVCSLFIPRLYILSPPPLTVTLSLSFSLTEHWEQGECLFLFSCWLHPPGGLSCFVAMQDTWLELAWQRCQGHCASSIADPLLHWEKWRWPKGLTLSPKSAPGSYRNIHRFSALSDVLFCIFIVCVNTVQGVLVCPSSSSFFLKPLTFPLSLCPLFLPFFSSLALRAWSWHDSAAAHAVLQHPTHLLIII